MAKQPLENPFRKTTGEQPRPVDNADLDEGRIVSAGVGITEGELAALDVIKDQVGAKRNAIMRLAIRLFIEGVRSEAIKLDQYFIEPEKPAKRMKFGKQTRR